MNYFLFSIVFLLTLSCNNDKKEQPQKPVPEKPALVSTDTFSLIRQKTAAIDQMEEAEKKLFSVDCNKKISVVYTSQQGKVVKIAVDFLKEGDNEVKADYYYDEDRLIYIFEIVRTPDMDQKTYSSYIANDKVIRYFWNHGESQCQKCEFNASSKEYKLLKATTAAEIESVLCR